MNKEELSITKEFAVSKSLVFRALTEHEHIKKWNSPMNFDVTFSEGELKVGEKYRCNICGNEVTVTMAGGGTLVCCGEDMERID